MKQKLKIGVLIDQYQISSWENSILQELVNSPYAEITVLVKKKVGKTTQDTFSEKLKKYGRVFLYEQYMKLEQRLISLSPDAFEPKDIRETVSVPELTVETTETAFSDRVVEEDIAKIKDYKLDVLLRFGFRILRGNILKCSKYGVWSYHHGDNNVNRGGPAGVWEVIKGWDETGVILQILTEDLDGGVKLFESYSSTDKSSIQRNRNNYYWKAKSFIPRKLKELYEMGEKDFFKSVSPLNNKPSIYYNELFITPGNFTMVKYITKRIWHTIKEKIRELFVLDQWILLYKFEKQDKISQSFFRFKRLVPPRDRFWADPFIAVKDNKYFVFLEEYIYKKGKGVISVIELNEKGMVGDCKLVLETDYHLSYPFLFEDGDKIYMIPESADNNTVELYECEEFPLKWKLKKVLLDNISAYDATIFQYDGKYWMFANVRTNEGASTWDELFLFYADDLFNEWKEHPMNPVVSDVKKARPAGNVIEYHGNLYRPGQNCAKRYGHGMTLSKITKLTETEYEEMEEQSIYPNWEKDLLATHTLNSKNRLTVIDAMIKRNRF
ncbi:MULTISPECIES: glucosamine inositolphosphorylceramide transferase family protein [Flavobacteriaceae]|uniref:glucosamine inositolphosphorylceramide transferase family protein n=1 Tax=Flavobacteriaceae TaxID=49546 RepID=UPI00234B2C73|nr:hypothetical protein [Muricauda sp. SP22]MDC6363545.1 hypothetical protein [Muricauda sp. SP22]